MKSVIIALSNCQFSGVLNGFEFVIGLIALYALKGLLTNRRVVSLHLVGHKKVNKADFRKSKIYGNLFDFVLALILAIVISCLELNLGGKVIITEKIEKNRDTCRVFDQYYDFHISEEVAIPQRYSLDSWTINIAQQLECKNGIASIDFAAKVGDPFITQPQVPICLTDEEKIELNMSTKAFSVASENLAVSLIGGLIHYEEEEIYFDQPAMMMLSYDVEQETGFSDSFHEFIYKNITACIEAGISSLPHTTTEGWEIANMNSASTARYILQQICQKHQRLGRPVEEIPESEVDICVEESPFSDPYDDPPGINLRCLSNAEMMTTYSVELDNIALLAVDDIPNFNTTEEHHAGSKPLFVDDNETLWAAKAFACPDVKVRIEYVFIPLSSFQNLPYNEEAVSSSGSVLVYTRVDVIEGSCEPTLHGIGTPALIHTANIEITGNNITTLSRTQIYHAHMIALARQQFPVESFSRPVNGTSSDCFLRTTKDATVINMEWYFLCVVILLSIFALMTIVYALSKTFIWYKGWEYPLREWIVVKKTSSSRTIEGENVDEERGEGSPGKETYRCELSEPGEVEICVSKDPNESRIESSDHSTRSRSQKKTIYILQYSI